jgi:hypothetical protein
MQRFVIILICLAIVLNGCQKPPTTNPTENNANPVNGLSPDKQTAVELATETDNRTDQEIDADIDAAWKSFKSFFPDVTFDREEHKAAAIEWSSEAAQLSVTDSSGLTWTLTIPAGALAEKQTITMVPLTNIDDGSGREKAGMLFEPDGLVFLEPAELTVTGPGAEKSLLLYADEQGKDMQIAPFTPIDGGVKALMFHFSTSFVDPAMGLPEEAARSVDMAYKLYDQYVDKAKDLLKKEIKPPKPLKINLACDGIFDPDAIKSFVKKYIGEELSYAMVMRTAYAAAIITSDERMKQDAQSLMEN